MRAFIGRECTDPKDLQAMIVLLVAVNAALARVGD